MISDVEKLITIIGLPETGKTSFIAAFHHFVSADNPNKTFNEYKLSSDATYLNNISSKWLQCEQLERTSTQAGLSAKDITIHLYNKSQNQYFDLKIPDIAGESFASQFTERLWDTQYFDSIKDTGALVLFISPTKLKAHALIDDIKAVVDIFSDPNEVQEIVPYKIEDTPTQVILTDILDAHIDKSPSTPLSLVIVISAWDKVSDEGVTPAKWLQVNLPLLNQFLITNFESINYKIFGISAQGGDLEIPEKKEELQDIDNPAERIIVQDGDQVSNDICAPIEWIINQWQKAI
ncbi:hypothetical protein [uncultured Mucilaginibacter sp.]|uniref:TRAFAC clade GTPase domain-containing protein n=1 Tax=uncultured Mucilaginibacter sp. TaxID=797541 RepID=UPI0025E3E42D|nr:hypothetical protein [uncultured Mucilaginibacter sp.]